MVLESLQVDCKLIARVKAVNFEGLPFSGERNCYRTFGQGKLKLSDADVACVFVGLKMHVLLQERMRGVSAIKVAAA